MKMPLLTICTEVLFDNYTFDPQPWWRPFLWWKIGRWDDEDMSRHFVVRTGIFGFHFLFAIHLHKEIVIESKGVITGSIIK